MVFYCGRCGKTFEQKYQLTNHLKKKVPCDFLCDKCGEVLSYHMEYARHVESNKCDPINYSNTQIEDKVNARNTSKENINQKITNPKQIDETVSVNNGSTNMSEKDEPKKNDKNTQILSILVDIQKMTMSKLIDIQKITESE